MDTENNEIENDELETQEPEQVEEVRSNPHEDRARADGWRPKEDWVADGRDPDDWKSAKSFNEHGEIIGTVKALQANTKNHEREVQERISNLNKMHAAQMETQLSELKSRQLDHVKNADEEAFQNNQVQIDKLEHAARTANAPQQPAASNDNEAYAAWNKANPWIDDGSLKSDFAYGEIRRITGRGITGEKALQLLDQKLNEKYPPQNERRVNAPTSEAPRKSRSTGPKTLSMSDVSDTEMKAARYFKDRKTGKLNEKKFLKSVQDSRT